MTVLNQFSDDLIKGKWARITMGDGSPCFIAIGPRSIVVKESVKGIIGPRVFEVRQIKRLEAISCVLSKQFQHDKTPADMTNVFLTPVVNAALHCDQFGAFILLLQTINDQLDLIADEDDSLHSPQT